MDTRMSVIMESVSGNWCTTMYAPIRDISRFALTNAQLLDQAVNVYSLGGTLIMPPNGISHFTEFRGATSS
jgi:hypothetical protein